MAVCGLLTKTAVLEEISRLLIMLISPLIQQIKGFLWVYIIISGSRDFFGVQMLRQHDGYKSRVIKK